MSALPKIPLDSSSDLTYLRQQLQEALASSLKECLPNALPEDSFRKTIELHISTFLRNTMQEAIPNVTINGMDPKPSDIAKGIQVDPESYETFDTGLQAAVLAQHEVLEDMITRVTTMRRQVPAEIKQVMEDRARESAAQEAQGQQKGELEEMLVEEGEVGAPIEIARLDEVKATYDAGVKILREMKGSVGSVNAKAQRAKEALTYIQQQQQATAKA